MGDVSSQLSSEPTPRDSQSVQEVFKDKFALGGDTPTGKVITPPDPNHLFYVTQNQGGGVSRVYNDSRVPDGGGDPVIFPNAAISFYPDGSFQKISIAYESAGTEETTDVSTYTDFVHIKNGIEQGMSIEVSLSRNSFVFMYSKEGNLNGLFVDNNDTKNAQKAFLGVEALAAIRKGEVENPVDRNSEFRNGIKYQANRPKGFVVNFKPHGSESLRPLFIPDYMVAEDVEDILVPQPIKADPMNAPLENDKRWREFNLKELGIEI